MARREGERDGSARDRRDAIAKGLAKRAVLMMAMRVIRRLLRRGVGRLLAEFKEPSRVMRGGDAIRDRRDGLNGQRQSEESNC